MLASILFLKNCQGPKLRSISVFEKDTAIYAFFSGFCGLQLQSAFQITPTLVVTGHGLHITTAIRREKSAADNLQSQHMSKQHAVRTL